MYNIYLFRTDWQNNRIIYSQYFPEKWLEGEYEFKGDALGLDVLRTGYWNLTLRDYSQTTRIKRNGHGVDVRVEIDQIGDMDIHVGNLLRGRSVLGKCQGLPEHYLFTVAHLIPSDFYAHDRRPMSTQTLLRQVYEV